MEKNHVRIQWGSPLGQRRKGEGIMTPFSMGGRAGQASMARGGWNTLFGSRSRHVTYCEAVLDICLVRSGRHPWAARPGRFG